MSKETRVVAYTCRYSSGPLIPNSATAIDWNIGINCSLQYLQVSLFLHFLFIWSLLPVKLQNFSLCLFVNYFENIIIYLHIATALQERMADVRLKD